jgi:hypothetical protein
MDRDGNASSNIAISGASILLSASHSPLPPYRPFAIPTNNARTPDLKDQNNSPKTTNPIRQGTVFWTEQRLLS